MSLTVSQIAASAGVSPDTVRYYEREGLMPPPERSPSGYRLYADADADRLRFIKGARRFGLRLREIRELLEVRDRGQSPCNHTGQLLTRRIAEVTQEIQRLEHLRKNLLEMAELYPQQCDVPGPDGWPCEVAFVKAGGERDG